MKEFIGDDRYTNLKSIGQGTYGLVAKAVDKVTGKQVAIKKISAVFADVADAKRILRELKLLRHLNDHENIIQIQDVLISPQDEKTFQDIFIVTNLMQSDLQYVIDTNQKLSEKHLQFFVYQILRALKYMHSANAIHRDLKPSNILVNGNCGVALCDFGLSRGYDDEEACLFTQYVATRWYRAPELLYCGKYGKPVDMWSVGCIFAELINKRVLFPGRDPQHQLDLIIRKVGCPDWVTLQALITNPTALGTVEAFRRRSPNVAFAHHFPAGTDPLALDLMRRMLEFNPAERITVDQALEHPFLAVFHANFPEPAAESPVDFSFEKRDDFISSLNDQEVRKYLFKEASEYRDYSVGGASGETVTVSATAATLKTDRHAIEQWRAEPGVPRVTKVGA